MAGRAKQRKRAEQTHNAIIGKEQIKRRAQVALLFVPET